MGLIFLNPGTTSDTFIGLAPYQTRSRFLAWYLSDTLPWESSFNLSASDTFSGGISCKIFSRIQVGFFCIKRNKIWPGITSRELKKRLTLFSRKRLTYPEPGVLLCRISDTEAWQISCNPPCLTLFSGSGFTCVVVDALLCRISAIIPWNIACNLGMSDTYPEKKAYKESGRLLAYRFPGFSYACPIKLLLLELSYG